MKSSICFAEASEIVIDSSLCGTVILDPAEVGTESKKILEVEGLNQALLTAAFNLSCAYNTSPNGLSSGYVGVVEQSMISQITSGTASSSSSKEKLK